MCIKKTTKRVKGKEYHNYLLVEAVSTPKGPRDWRPTGASRNSASARGGWCARRRSSKPPGVWWRATRQWPTAPR